jgi:cyanophycinase
MYKKSTSNMEYSKGYLVSIGGGEDKGDTKDEERENNLDFLENGILKNVVSLIQEEQPIIEVITTATSYPLDSYRNYRDAFMQLGCVNIGHLDIRDRASANDDEMLERVSKCHAVMVSGGDQSKLTAILGGTAVLKLIRERYQNEEFVIAGTSAGAASMSATMMYGGSTEKAYFKGEILLSAGFGFISDVIIDTHFDARGRFARLAQAVAAQPGILGIGLSEDTGVIIEEGRKLKVIGSSSVTIIDGSEAEHNNIAEVKKGAPITISKLAVHILANSDLFDLQTKQFTPIPFKEHVS